MVGGCLVFFALSQLSYHFPFIPSILVFVGVVLLIWSYIRRRRKKLRAFPVTKSKQDSTSYENGNYNPIGDVDKDRDEFQTNVGLEQKSDDNENPTSSPHKMPPREKP
jgi:hypothetical protein